MVLAERLQAAGRTWRTVRHLTPEQWAYRVRNRGARAVIQAQPGRFAAWLERQAEKLPLPEPRMGGAAIVLAHQAYLHGPHLAEMRRGRFTFLNRTVDLDEWPGLDWRVDLGEKNNPLWRMNLSYFGYLVPMLARGGRQAMLDAAALIEDFDQHCGPGAPGALRDAWTAFSASFRVIHLLAAWTLYRKAGGPPEPKAEDVLARHVRRCVAYTYHLREAELGYNHMLKNLAALAVFEGCTDRQSPWHCWLEKALPACAEAQFLPDGGHVERSPMYQGLALQDLRIAAASWSPAASPLQPVIERAAGALAAMVHPDGEIALFNDAWIGEAPPPSQHGVLPLTDGTQVLPDTGYGRLSDGGDCLLFDAGPVGPDANPGHAHGDFLSFELSIAGERAVVDTGTPTYSAGVLRNLCRSAHAHNGPRLKGLEPIEAWASFRVGARGKAWFADGAHLAALAPLSSAGICDGYWQKAGVCVARWLGFWPGHQLLVVDQWSKPDARARTDLLLTQALHIEPLTGSLVSREADRYWPRFGAPEPAERLSLAPDGASLAFVIRWGEPLTGTADIVAHASMGLTEALNAIPAAKLRQRRR